MGASRLPSIPGLFSFKNGRLRFSDETQLHYLDIVHRNAGVDHISSLLKYLLASVRAATTFPEPRSTRRRNASCPHGKLETARSWAGKGFDAIDSPFSTRRFSVWTLRGIWQQLRLYTFPRTFIVALTVFLSVPRRLTIHSFRTKIESY